MRSTVVCAALLLMAMPSAVAAQATFGFPASDGTVGDEGIDLLDPNVTAIQFVHNQTDVSSENPAYSSAWVTLTQGADSFDVSLQSTVLADGTITWAGSLHLDVPDLTTGAWDVRLLALQGNAQVQPEPARSLNVSAPGDVQPPQIVIPGSNGGVVQIGKAEDLAVAVTDELLRKVTYQLPGMPTPLTLREPYILSTKSFAEGPQILTLYAIDRTGLDSTIQIIVDKDVTDPELEVTVPAVFYADVPNDLRFNVSDSNAYMWEIRIGGQSVETAEEEKHDGGRGHVVQITPNGTGNHTLFVQVQDTFGNSASFTTTFEALPVHGDVAIKKIEPVNRFPLANQDTRWRVTLSQPTGVTALPVEVQVLGADVVAKNGTVPLAGETAIEFAARLAPGRHVLNHTVTVPVGVNETDGSNDNATVTLEVFQGRVEYQGARYYIRVDDRGIPLEAVDREDKAYPLTLENDVRRTGYTFTALYTFEADGTALYWDPSTSVTVVPQEEAPVDETPPEKDGNFIPAPLWALPLGLAAAGLLGRRRR